jgi:hypothetical protein
VAQNVPSIHPAPPVAAPPLEELTEQELLIVLVREQHLTNAHLASISTSIAELAQAGVAMAQGIQSSPIGRMFGGMVDNG